MLVLKKDFTEQMPECLRVFFASGKMQILLILLIPIFILMPYIAGYVFQGEDYFTGYMMNSHDQNIYFSFMKQAEDGHSLFLNLSSDIPHKRQYLHTLFLLTGATSRVLHLPLWLVYLVSAYIFSVVFGFLMLKIMQKFLSKGWATTGLMILLLGSGFGLFGKIYGFVSGIEITVQNMTKFPCDLWMPSLTVWNSINYTPLFIWSYLLIIVTYVGIWQGEKKESFFPFVFSGVAAALIALSHSYDLVPLGFVSLLILVLYRVQTKRIFPIKVFLGYSFYAIFMIGATAYQYYVLKTNPGFSIWAEKNVNLSPNFLVILAGYGLLSLGYVECLLQLRSYKKISLEIKFLGWWLLLQTSMLYSPFPFSRRFALGIFVPLAIFFVLFLKRIMTKPSMLNFSVCTMLVLATFLTPVYQVAANLAKVAQKDARFFYTQDKLKAFESLDNGLTQTDVILADLDSSNSILRFTPAALCAGSTQQTPEQTIKQVDAIYSGQTDADSLDIVDFFKEHNVSYIFVDRVNNADFLEKFATYLTTHKVHFENDGYIVYNVIR